MLRLIHLISIGAPLFLAGTAVSRAEPHVSGLATSQLAPDLKARVLLEELNCAACHGGDDALATASRKAPRLAGVGSRVHPEYLEAFIRDPHGTKPGTTMPDVMAHLSDEDRGEAAKSITHYLLSLKENTFAPEPPDPVAASAGKDLFHSRGCATCHSPRDADGSETLADTSVPLGALDKKYSFPSLVTFLQNPHAARPSGRMPDLRLSRRDNEQIAHFLLQDTRVPGHLAYTLFEGQVWEGLASENVTALRAGHTGDFDPQRIPAPGRHTALRFEGWLHVKNPGLHTFFLTANGGSLVIDGQPLIQQDPSNRRGVMKLEGSAELAVGWVAIQLTYFHTGREPMFSFEMEGPEFARQPIPSALLSISNEKIPAFQPPTVDRVLAARGREQFKSLGCANCHDDIDGRSGPALEIAKLDRTRGCLDPASTTTPRFGLSEPQSDLLRAIVPLKESPALDDRQRIDKTLAALNCTACHEREGLGGIDPQRNALFTGTQPGLGDQGRLPPPLSHAGAKLKPGWLADVLLHGKRQRGYLDASMPQFGEANVGHLVELFGKVDKLEDAVMPKISNIQESKDAGYDMIGVNGLGCIACHEFNGQKPGDVAALDLARMTERLDKNWFALFMRQPSRFHPTVIMPEYWPGGQSVRPDILGGDPAQQIEAIWAYLGDGQRAKKPVGLSRQSNEIRVADVAEMCRGRGPAGYRGVGVGYPEGLNLAFDSEEMALREIWKGGFANINFGSFQPNGTDRIAFAPGVPFHHLKSLDDEWPYKGKTNHTFPADQGYRFLGYRLDDKRRPTFRYRYGAIAVEEEFMDLRDKNGNAYLRRTLRFDAPTAQELFHFRAATGERAAAPGDRTFRVDNLDLRVTSEHPGTVRPGSPAEVLIPLTLPAGRSTLTLEYQW